MSDADWNRGWKAGYKSGFDVGQGRLGRTADRVGELFMGIILPTFLTGVMIVGGGACVVAAVEVLRDRPCADGVPDTSGCGERRTLVVEGGAALCRCEASP